MQINIHSEISQIPGDSWNKLVKDNNPFVRHEFLSALETHGCASQEFGWHPCHIAIYEEDQLVAAMPLYTKTNTYGEFVFDHAWSDAYHRNNIPYFPKLVSSIPYTPASGQRLLCESGRSDELYPLLIETIKQFAGEQNYSSFHCLFANSDEQDWLEDYGLLARHDCQFHWHNQDYSTFDDFLAKLTPKKRKNIRQERRRVEQQAVNLRILNGHTATDEDWKNFSKFYEQTFAEKYGTATLNEGFFKEVAHALPDQVILVLADDLSKQPEGSDTGQEECIAGSLMFASDTILYGRHWGCIEQIDKLHFEACYYQGIEYCIEHKLQTFEPGAQGEHKIARGFIPTLTRSSHWLNNSPFQESIENYVKHEQAGVKAYMDSLKSPYQEEK
ncbi:GNAT family N-acetyltransferase [uncultured Cocleimonas sp.]|uniref:GNAT family N-acetyltransferase n=1 Tax=uncultured Cocleimonas sp. TaxID=1051587 RepID=UPI00260C2D70|nr:GNAT family N-acetyltransferase [uncultured Cocleimonas sp.]